MAAHYSQPSAFTILIFHMAEDVLNKQKTKKKQKFNSMGNWMWCIGARAPRVFRGCGSPIFRLIPLNVYMYIFQQRARSRAPLHPLARWRKLARLLVF